MEAPLNVHYFILPTQWVMITKFTETKKKYSLLKNKTKKFFKIVKKIPFSSERKKMITVHKFSNLKYFVYVKGATELIIEKCSGMITDKKMIL